MAKKFRPVFTTEAFVLAAALIVTLPLRTIQYFTVIEGGSGFYTQTNANIIIYAVVLAAATAFFIVSAFLKRKRVSLETAPQKLPGCGIISFLTAAAMLYSAYTEYSLRNVDASEYSVTSTAAKIISGPFVTVQAVFGIIAAIFFVLIGVCFVTGKSSGRFKLLSLTPVIWCILRLIVRFTRTISYLRVSDLALEMITLIFFILFFMAFAQTNSEVEGKGNEWKLTGLGFPGAMFALNLFVPRAVLVLTGKESLLYILSRADVSDLAIALFIVATVLTRIVPNISNIVTKQTNSDETADS